MYENKKMQKNSGACGQGRRCAQPLTPIMILLIIRIEEMHGTFFFYLCIFYFLRIGEIHGTVNPLVGRLTLPGLPRLLLYTRSLLLGLSRRILRSLLPYTRSLLPHTRSLLPHTRSLLPYLHLATQALSCMT